MAPPQCIGAHTPTTGVVCHSRTVPPNSRTAALLPAELPASRCNAAGRVRDPAIFPHFASTAALGYRHNDPVLVNIKPDIRDTIPQGPSPMHEARHRPIRCNPRHLHTEKRVAPSLRWTCRLASTSPSACTRARRASLRSGAGLPGRILLTQARLTKIIGNVGQIRLRAGHEFLLLASSFFEISLMHSFQFWLRGSVFFDGLRS